MREVRQQDIVICSPLGFVPKKNGKLHLLHVLDLRSLNKHLFVQKFKYEDLLVVSQITAKGDWFITFDLRNGYHHIDIGRKHRKYLRFSFPIDGCVKYFVFTSLPFGLATALFVFAKVLWALVKHWRIQGIRAVLYLDDGFVVASSQQAMCSLATTIRSDLDKCGFFIKEEKSQLDPHQAGELLGYSVDLENGVFSVPQKKVNGLLNLLHDIRSQHKCVSARAIARVTRTIISMGLALGPVARLFSRHLYAVQNNVVCLSEQVSLSHYALSEIQFWIDNFAELVGQPMWHSSLCIDVISYSDASSSGWAGYVVQLGSLVA